MKNISNGYLEWLLSTDVESCYTCDLIEVVLPSGLILYITDGQLPISWGGNIYEPATWGYWQITRTSCAIGALAASCEFTVWADSTVTMPQWKDTLMHAIQAGLFDGASFAAVTMSMDAYGDVSLGGSIRFAGQITTLERVGGTEAQGTAKPYTFTMNKPMPRHILQPGCGWVFGDAGCTINTATYTFSYIVGAGTTNIQIVTSAAISQASGYFTQGILTFTSGLNSGLSGMVQMHTNNNLRLVRPFLFPVALGDTFTVTAGCDHTFATCQQKFGNQLNFGGQPYIPNMETAL